MKAGPPNRAEITAAIDADLTTTPTAAGDERHLAGGVEAWLANRSVGLRAGVGTNTIELHCVRRRLPLQGLLPERHPALLSGINSARAVSHVPGSA